MVQLQPQLGGGTTVTVRTVPPSPNTSTAYSGRDAGSATNTGAGAGAFVTTGVPFRETPRLDCARTDKGIVAARINTRRPMEMKRFKATAIEWQNVTEVEDILAAIRLRAGEFT